MLVLLKIRFFFNDFEFIFLLFQSSFVMIILPLKRIQQQQQIEIKCLIRYQFKGIYFPLPLID